MDVTPMMFSLIYIGSGVICVLIIIGVYALAHFTFRKNTRWTHNGKDLLTLLLIITICGVVVQTWNEVDLLSYDQGGITGYKRLGGIILAPGENRSYWLSNVFTAMDVTTTIDTNGSEIIVEIVDENRPDIIQWSTSGVNIGDVVYSEHYLLPYRYTSIGQIAHWSYRIINSHENTSIRILRGKFGICIECEDYDDGLNWVYIIYRLPIVAIISTWIVCLWLYRKNVIKMRAGPE